MSRSLLACLIIGLLLARPAASVGPRRPAFRNPPTITSENGILHAELVAAPAFIEVGGRRVFTNVYNGAYIPPMLVVNRGDTIHLRLTNLLGDMTNMHYHGYDGPPNSPADDVFLHIMPANSFDYELPIPEVQGIGLNWYHPHMHGMVEAQIFGGMSGAYLVNGMLDPFPQLAGITDRVLLLKDIQIRDGHVPQENIDIGAPSIRTVNGLVNPTIPIHPGETQLWRFGNIGADRYYRLRLEGHTMYEIARDGNRNTQLVPRKEIFLPPSSRSEVLIQGGRRGQYRLQTLAVSTGPQGDQYAGATLATLVSSGPAQTPVALPTSAAFPPVLDLRTLPIAHQRPVVYTESANGDEFFINGKQFDENRIDVQVKLGDVEEWTITNSTGELHTFHIHQLGFQVTEINGAAQPFYGYQDNINIPHATRQGPGVVKVLIPFTNPLMVGKFVMHCHITQHEDNGMMATVEVSP